VEPILEVKNLCKNYGNFSLKNVNIRLDRGYIMGFIGPNGAGKSTTIKLIMNLIKKDSGTIKIFQLDHQKNELAIKDRIGFVYDENYYYEELTVEEMKNFVKPFYSRWDEAAFKNYVDQFELPLKKPIKNLSKGMKMKFSLAIALSHHAELLIMDEPTSGLDPIIRSEFLEILQSFIQDENKSVFFSTHITSDLDKIADYITLIDDGEIILSKTKDELMEEYCLIKGTSDMVESLPMNSIIGIRKNAFGFEALSSNKKLFTKTFGDSVIIEKPTLEDIMIFSTKRRGQYASSY